MDRELVGFDAAATAYSQQETLEMQHGRLSWA